MEDNKKALWIAKFLLLDMSVALIVAMVGFSDEPPFAACLVGGVLTIAVIVLTRLYRNDKIDDVMLAHCFMVIALSTVAGIVSLVSDVAMGLMTLISWIMCFVNPYKLRRKNRDLK